MSILEFPTRGKVGQPNYDRAAMSADTIQLAMEVMAKSENHITDEEAEALIAAIGALDGEEADAVMRLVHKCFRALMEKRTDS